MSASACGKEEGDGEKKTANITVKIQNIDSGTGLYDLRSDSAISLTTEQPYVTQRSFTPVSYKFPLAQIEMFGTDVTGGTVYKCPGATAADCLVDLADKSAVAALIKNPVPVTYLEGSDPKITKFEVTVDPTCGNGGGGMTQFNVMVKGTLSVGGTTYYTTSQATEAVLTADQSKYSEVGVPMRTCTMSWYLPTPVSVTGQADADGIVASGDVNNG